MTFVEWLISEKGYTQKSAGDARSRLKRALRLSGEDSVSEVTIQLLEDNYEFRALSNSVKCQIKKAVMLYKEFERPSKYL